MKEQDVEENLINTNEPVQKKEVINDENKKSIFEEDIYAVFINHPELNDPHERNVIDTSKYKWFNFLAKILMEQFSRLANVYFLIIAVLQSIKELSYSGGSPIILLPLAFVVLLNGVKDLYEDFKRKKSDNKENNTECEIYDNVSKSFRKKKWKDVKLGHIVKVYENQQFPVDLLLLSTSDDNGICYVETKNLDGETNLKFRQANKTLHTLIKEKNYDVSDISHVCITKPPNEFIYKFDASVYSVTNDGKIMDKDKFELYSIKSFLLRGCVLRQTKYIIGAAIYIGVHTKSMINSPDLKNKHSSVEAGMNKQLVGIFIIQVVLSFILAIVYTIIYANGSFGLQKYYFDELSNYAGVLFTITGTWIIICTNFVPISLLVTMETIKFFQGMFMEWDIDLYDKESCTGCKVQTSTLNEELGQIRYVFSDKTGTLTKNYMKYKMMSIGDKIYGTLKKDDEENSQNNLNENDNLIDTSNENNIINNNANDQVQLKDQVKDKYGDIPNVEFVDDKDSLKNDMQDPNRSPLIEQFMLCLSLCNTVLIDANKKQEKNIIDYQASSPDEKALVCFARSQGYILKNRDINENITLEINGVDTQYQLLKTLEYSSERKRMSVIVRTPTNQIIVYAKGADSMIESLLCEEDKNSELLKTTNEFLKVFAKGGLRTLMTAYKEITEEYYNIWNNEFIQTKANANHTEDDINNLYDKIEKDFKILGSTAIEDELQDNVGEIIHFMMKTGMRVWMLTGDKLDTAKNIAISCKLFQKQMKIIEVPEHSSDAELKSILLKTSSDDTFDDENVKVGLIISSEEIQKIFNDEFLLSLFFEISVHCLTVVCSRVSPKQKGELVNLIKTTEKAITLAVGDGANDVGMITEANVGVGIQGKEGTQAARASDYAIKEFSHLKKLLFFHGRESYRKNSWVILYNFYKNFVFVSPMVWNAFISLFSATSIYDAILHQMINIIYTSVPPVLFGIFNYEYPKQVLLTDAKYYIQGIYFKLFHFKRFVKFFLLGFYEGFVIFILAHFYYAKGNSDGKTNDFYSIGTVMFGGVVFITNLKIIIDMHYYDIISIIILFLSVFLFFVTVALMSDDSLTSEDSAKTFDTLGNFVNVLMDGKFFTYIFLVCAMCGCTEIFIKRAQVLFGFVIEGKDLKPYEKKRRKKLDFEIIESVSPMKLLNNGAENEEKIKNDDEEKNIIKTDDE